MNSRKSFVAGNWKMNGDIDTNKHLLATLRAGIERAPIPQVEIAVAPPFPYLGQARDSLQGCGIAWGAQNVAAAPNGALTGEVSASMLNDFGCRWAIVGHSERRTQFGERNDLIARKVAVCVASGLGVIVCVGETLDEREQDRTEAVLARQVGAVAGALRNADPARTVLAYEPIWAIGTGRSASPETIQQAHAFIRGRLSDGGVSHAESIRVLYGGSVKASNAQDIFTMPDVDGGLIGGASLDAEEFLEICRAAA